MRVEVYQENTKLKQKDVHCGKVPIKSAKDHVYLGNTIESNGSNEKTILARVSKGQAVVIRDIIQILNGTLGLTILMLWALLF